MRYVVWIIAMLAWCHLGADPVQAQAGGCDALAKRIERQDRINAAHRCRLPRTSEQAQRRRNSAIQRCRRADRSTLLKLVGARAAALERCLTRQLASQNAPRSGLTANRAERTGNAKYETKDRDGDQRRTIGPRTSGQRVKELLAEAPIDNRAVKDGAVGPADRDREFRSGLVWSYAGPLDGMHCVQWREPSDPHNWDDNFLCTERDVGLQWSFRGPILGRGLKCIQVREKSDPHDWHDNYFCWPRDLKVTFRFSATGRIAGFRCVAIVEPSDPDTWRDNYLCHRGKAG